MILMRYIKPSKNGPVLLPLPFYTQKQNNAWEEGTPPYLYQVLQLLSRGNPINHPDTEEIVFHDTPYEEREKCLAYIKERHDLDLKEVVRVRRRQTKVNNELHRIFAAKKQKRLQEEAAEEQKRLNQEAKEILQRQKRKEKKKKQKKIQKEKKKANEKLVVEVVPSLSVKDLVRKGITSGAEWDMANELLRESQSFQGKGPSYFAPEKPVGGDDTPLVVCPVSESDIDRAIADGGGIESLGKQRQVRAYATLQSVPSNKARYMEMLSAARNKGVPPDSLCHPSSEIDLNVLVILVNHMIRKGLDAGSVKKTIYDCFRIYKEDTGLSNVPQKWKDTIQNALERALELRRVERVEANGTDVFCDELLDTESVFGTDINASYGASNAGARSTVANYLMILAIHRLGIRVEHLDHILLRSIVHIGLVANPKKPGEVLVIIDCSKQGHTASTKSDRRSHRTGGKRKAVMKSFTGYPYERLSPEGDVLPCMVLLLHRLLQRMGLPGLIFPKKEDSYEVDYEIMGSKNSVFQPDLDWTKGNLPPNRTGNIVDLLKQRGDEASMKLLQTPLFGDGRDPKGMAAVVKLEFHKTNELAKLNQTARGLRGGGSQDVAMNAMARAPAGMEYLANILGAKAYLGHTTFQNLKNYDPAGRMGTFENSSSAVANDPDASPNIGNLMLSSPELAHNLKNKVKKGRFVEDALRRKAIGGRGANLFKENLYLAKFMLNEDYDRIIGSLVNSGKTTCSFKTAWKRVLLKWFIMTNHCSNLGAEQEGVLRSSRKELFDAAHNALCQVLWEMKPGGSSDAMYFWVKDNLWSILDEQLVTAKGNERGLPWSFPTAPSGTEDTEYNDSEGNASNITLDLESPRSGGRGGAARRSLITV